MIRRVGKNEIIGTDPRHFSFKKHGNMTGMDVSHGGQAAAVEVGPQDPERLWIRLHERHSLGTAAEGFDPDGSGSGVEIQHTRPGDARAQDRKQRLSHSVWSWTQT